MKPRPDRRSQFWDCFNALGKLVGYLFMVGGSIISVFGALKALRREDGGEAREFILVMIVALIVTALGFLLVKARPFSLGPLKPDGEHREDDSRK